MRSLYWGFGPSAFPVQGRVWMLAEKQGDVPAGADRARQPFDGGFFRSRLHQVLGRAAREPGLHPRLGRREFPQQFDRRRHQSVRHAHRFGDPGARLDAAPPSRAMARLEQRPAKSAVRQDRHGPYRPDRPFARRRGRRGRERIQHPRQLSRRRDAALPLPVQAPRDRRHRAR